MGGVGSQFYKRMVGTQFYTQHGVETPFYSQSAVPRAYQLSQENIRCPKSISAVPGAYQLSQEHISSPKTISAFPTQYQLSQGNISSPKAISAIPRQYQLSQVNIRYPRAHQVSPENTILKPSYQKMIRLAASIMICRKELEKINVLVCFLSKIPHSYPRRRETFVSIVIIIILF